MNENLVLSVQSKQYSPRFRQGDIVVLTNKTRPNKTDTLAYKDKNGEVIFIDYDSTNEQSRGYECIGTVDFIDLRHRNNKALPEIYSGALEI